LAGPLQFAWTTKAEPRTFEGSLDIIDIEYTVTIGTSLGDGIGGDFRHTVSFAKRPSSLKFGFDVELSQMKESEFLSLYDVGNFDRWNQLVRLAEKQDPSFTDVFDRVLKACVNAEPRVWNCHDLAEELVR
jgi:hypothetical protein